MAQGNNQQTILNEKILYIKGGNAVEEGERLIPQRGKLRKGGPDQFVLAVLSLMHKNASLRLVTFGKEKKEKKIGNIELIEFDSQKTAQSIFSKIYYRLILILRFAISSIFFRPDVVLCGLDGIKGLIALICAKVSRSKFIFSAHTNLNLDQFSQLHILSNKFLVCFSDCVLVHGEFLADQALEYGINRTKLFCYASTIDDDELTLINIQKKHLIEKPAIIKTILFTGRMEENKGIYDLLEAFCLAKLENTELIYIGSGDGLIHIQSYVEHKKIRSVRFLGQIPYIEIYPYLCAATVLIAPTQSVFPEGRCKSVVEAFFAGIPVITPDYGCFPYLVEHGVNGLVYPADSVRELTDAIVNLMQNPELILQLREGAVNTGKKLFKSRSFKDTLAVSLE
jgi:glycosyltransferase involved in cell wall biosynthesis